jgi:hypothetical protein
LWCSGALRQRAGRSPQVGACSSTLRWCLLATMGGAAGGVLQLQPVAATACWPRTQGVSCATVLCVGACGTAALGQGGGTQGGALAAVRWAGLCTLPPFPGPHTRSTLRQSCRGAHVRVGPAVRCGRAAGVRSCARGPQRNAAVLAVLCALPSANAGGGGLRAAGCGGAEGTASWTLGPPVDHSL